MNDAKEQTWVTTAVDDSQCVAALVLCQTLRRVITTRKTTVLISRKVSKAMRIVLEAQFDAVIKIDMDDAAAAKLPLPVYMSIYGWQLTFFKKCVYIHSDTLVLENCDDIFDLPGFTSTKASTVFVFEPSFSTFDNIVLFSESAKGDYDNLLNLYFTKSACPQTVCQLLPAKYSIDLTETSTDEQFPQHVKTVHFPGPKPWSTYRRPETPHRLDPELSRQYSQLFQKIWLDILREDIQPKLPVDVDVSQELKDILQTNSSNLATDSSFISKETNKNLSESIAVIGLSCRFPGANTPDEFWELLSKGIDAIRTVPLGRWDANDCDVDEEALRKTRAGFLKCAIDEFDAKFFGISPREAGYMDPQQRLLLEVAWEGLENAGINPLSLKGSNTGVFTGIWTGDYEAMLRKNTTGGNAHRVYLGNAYSATSSRVSFFLGLNGPNIAIESGCSSSFVSLHLACESLRKGDCKIALSGGVNLVLFPYSLVGSQKPYFMAPDGHCKTFDAKADGFGRAEGCGIVVLKRFSDAQRDNDRILGVIRGSAINMEGTTASFGTPSKACQEMVIKDAIKNANIDPTKISYIEAHGTGTIVGDPIEVSALTEAYSIGRKEPLFIGSVKTNIGHAEGAAGIAGLIKVLLCLKHDTIPPHLNFESLNPEICLEKIPALIPFKTEKWEKKENELRLAGINSFGISGTNVHVIVEEPPVQKHLNVIHPYIDRSHHVLTLSAKSEHTLMEVTEKYLQFLGNNTKLTAADVTYTANTGRAHFLHRIAVVGNDIIQLKNNLNKKVYASGRVISPKPTIAFLFTGQGSQYPGMAKRLYKSHPVFKNALNKCEMILQNNLGFSLLDIIWSENQNGPKLDQTLYSQTSIFCIEYSLLQLWRSFGVNPDYVLGHSVGEFAAATAAGIITLEDALKLVSERSKLIQSLPPGGMLAIRASLEKVKSMITIFNSSNENQWLDIAVINTMEEVVVAGRPNSLESFSEACVKENIKTQRVSATHAFHSRDMENIMIPFGKVADSISYSTPNCGYVSGRDGKILRKDDMNSTYWQKHARENVNFTLGIKRLFDTGCRVFIEVGPHPVLLALALNNLPALESMEATWLPTIRRNEEEWSTISKSLGKLYVNGIDIDWKKFDEPYLRQKLDLPTYPFQRQKYWFEHLTEPNSLSCNTKVLHPLLGRNIPVATNDMKVNLYQQSILLDNLPYFVDHQVANKIIMPGAGFFEMILAAGNLAMQGSYENFGDPKTPFIVQDFIIELPLELLPEKACQLQTTVAPIGLDNSEELKISLFRKTDTGTAVWKRHASAKFIPNLKDISLEYSQSYNLTEIKARCETQISTKDLYKKVAEVGIAFGPTFQSIQEFWKGTNEVLAQVLTPESSSDKRDYICHPIVLDSMLQAYSFQIDLDAIALHLPVAIEKFIWLSRKQTKIVYLYIAWNNDNPEPQQKTGLVKLLDDSGNTLCVMQGVRLVKTSIAAFVNFLSVQKRDIPGLYLDAFKPTVGSEMSRVDMRSLPDCTSLVSMLEDYFNSLAAITNKSSERYVIGERTVYMYMLDALYELGWEPYVGQIIRSRDFLQTLMISFRHTRFVERMLNICVEERLLEKYENTARRVTEWKVIRTPPGRIEVQQIIEEVKQIYSEPGAEIIEIPILNRCGRSLAAVLQEKESGLAVLFPENAPEQSASRIYTHAEYCIVSNQAIQQICETIFGNVKRSGEVVRILEIGGGSGSTSEYVLAAFNNINVPFSFTFTDISPIFLAMAADKFKDVSRMKYKVLNIEIDPKAQGFGPHQFDLVVCANVLHATADIMETMHNIRHLLSPAAYLLNFEMFEPIRPVDLIFGVLEGYWRYSDTNLRPDHPLLNRKQWESVARESGFTGSKTMTTWLQKSGIVVNQADSTHSIYGNKFGSNDVWFIFSDKGEISTTIEANLKRDGKRAFVITQGESFKETSENEFSVNPTSHDHFENLFDTASQRKLTVEGAIYMWGLDATTDQQESICAGLLYYSQCLLVRAHRVFPRLVLVTRGNFYTGDEEPNDPTSAVLRGMVLTLKSEQPGLNVICFDFDPDETLEDIAISELYNELWSQDLEQKVAMRQRKRFVSRLVQLDSSPVPLIIPNNDRYSLVLPASNAIPDLILEPIPRKEISNISVEVSVGAVGLNFRDLFVIMKPDTFESLITNVGIEFSGTVTTVGSEVSQFKPGDAVFGFAYKGAVASHINVPHTSVMRKPAFLTHAEAATMPVVFFTAHISLHIVAKIKQSDTVLIHVASGGVGLAAFQICKHVGCEVIATAGSRRKRAYLRSLGIKHVFHSRNISFGDDIMAVTGGNGVDIVLNSLTGPNFKETSLRICKPKARFVELSKINIWEPEEVKQMRPDVCYTIINLESGLDEYDLSSSMESFIFKRLYTPLPYTRFDVTQIKEAFDYFQKAHHIGKCIVTMPEINYFNGSIQVNENIFNPDSTYLITGGLGGIGLEVTKFISNSGGRNIVLVGRSPPDDTAEELIKSLASKGIRVVTSKVDVGDRSQVEELLQMLKKPEMNLPPLKGIMHAAGFLSDGMVVNQTLDKFNTVFNAKVKGAWNLHYLTQGYNLEHFVLYSSAAALIGPPGQSNHAAANTFLDTFAHYRHALGLPVQTINWGIWSEIGAAAELALGKEGAFGVKPFSPAQGIAALRASLKFKYLQVLVTEIDLNQFKEDVLNMGPYIAELTEKAEVEVSAELAAEGEKMWQEITESPAHERAAVIKIQIEAMIRQTLKLPTDEPLDENQNFSDMGLDSLMAVEMRNKLQLIFGSHLTVNTTALLDNPNINGLSNYLAGQITSLQNEAEETSGHGKAAKSSAVDHPEIEILNGPELVKQDSILPAHIIGQNNYIKPSKFKHIFVTGVTGQLGIYILPELTSIKNLRVHCLIRAKSAEDAKKRLSVKLKKHGLLNTTNLDNVVYHTGNIVEKRLGLSLETYDDLAERIDAIIHCAVKSNHVDEYKIHKSLGGHDLRSVNVSGTVNILEFAAKSKTKQVLHASSIVAVTDVTDEGLVSEQLPSQDNNGEGITWGYALSKFVSEKLIRQAIERGIPCKVVRFPAMAGNSQTGQFAPESNHLMLFILACMHLGIAPNMPGSFSTITIDTAAKISVKLLLNESAESGAYNINNPFISTQEELNAVIRDMGHIISVVSESTWISVIKAKGEESVLFPLKDLYLKKNGLSSFIQSNPATKKIFTDNSNGKMFEISQKLKISVPDVEKLIPHTTDICRKHLDFAKKEGLFKMFSLV